MFYVLTAKKSTVFFILLSSLKVSQQMCIYTNEKKVYNTFTTNNIKRCAIRTWHERRWGNRLWWSNWQSLSGNMSCNKNHVILSQLEYIICFEFNARPIFTWNILRSQFCTWRNRENVCEYTFFKISRIFKINRIYFKANHNLNQKLLPMLLSYTGT